MGMSGSDATNPQSVSLGNQGPGSGIAASPQGTRTIAKASRAGKKFDNNPDQLVHRHRKTTYTYRIGIRLPKETLQQFPRYNGKVKDFSYQWSGSFVTFKITPSKLYFIGKQQSIPPAIIVPPLPSTLPVLSRAPTAAATSVPSLLSADPSSFSGGYHGASTPITAYPSPEAGQRNARAKLATQELLAATAGSFNNYDQTGVSGDYRLLRSSALLDSPFPLSSQPKSGYEDIPISERLVRNSTMGPVKDTSSVHNTIRDVVQHLTDIQILTHGYIPATQELLVDKLTDLTQSLADLKHLTSKQESPNSYIHQVAIAPEIVDYVDDGRNPDIFTRDFVEIVQRGNAVINGKQEAFKGFTEVFAQKLKKGIPGVSGQVDRVLKNAGFEEQEGSRTNGARAGAGHVGEHTAGTANG